MSSYLSVFNFRFLLNCLKKLSLIYFILLSVFCFPSLSEQLNENAVVLEYLPQNEKLVENINSFLPKIVLSLEKELGLGLKHKVKLIVCPDTESFNKMTGVNHESVQGVAFSEFNLIVINAEKLQSKTNKDIENLIKHELVHIVLGTNISHGSDERLPRWLNEGVAQWLSNGANELFTAHYQDSLQTAFLTRKTLTFSSLTYYFPGDNSQFTLAYAQSLSIVDYLAETYGKEKITDLLRTMTEGKNFRDAFFEVYNKSFDTLAYEWKESKSKSSYTLDYYLATHINLIMNSLIGFVAFFVFIVYFIRKRIHKKTELSDENPEI